MEEEIDVPPFFVCPISLEIMKDPVTISTGITYDRESIEKWLFSSSSSSSSGGGGNNKNKTCPVTKQPLSDSTDLTPNHTLRRLIQAWCTMHASHGIQRIPTPKPPVNKNHISKLLKDASYSPSMQIDCLRRLKSIAAGSETNKRVMEAAGAVDFLASIVTKNVDSASASSDSNHNNVEDDALSMLHNLHISEAGLKNLLSFRNGEFVNTLTRVLEKGSYESRPYAVFLLKSMSEVADPVHLLHLRTQLFVQLVQTLKDQISHKVSKATLQTLIHTCPMGRNRIKAVEADAVTVLTELLLNCHEKKPCEMVMVLLELLCQCAEGRAQLLSHGAGLAIVSKKIMRVSTLANDRAVRILLSISKFSATPAVVQEMLKLGVVAKLCLMLQVDTGNKSKEKAREILKLHARSWRNSPCIPTNLISSYPAYD